MIPGVKVHVMAAPTVSTISTSRVLVADDQPNVIDALLFLLKAANIGADRASSPEEVLAMVGGGKYDLLLMDMNYARDTTSGEEGLELLHRVKSSDPALSVVVMTAWSTIEIAVASLQHGASDFIQKPWDNDAALRIIEAQIAACKLRRREISASRAEAEDAVQVHRTLLGASFAQFGRFTVAAGTRSHREVGGDYFDFFEIREDQVAIAIADVMGKGVGAALLMANLQAHFRTHAQHEKSPAEICDSLNTTLLQTSGGRLATMIAAQLNVPAGVFTFCTAGHPEAIYVSAAGNCESLSSDGAVMGSFATARYKNETRELQSGDRIVLVTDGFLEAENASGEELGASRLAGWVVELRSFSASEMYDRLNARLFEFTGQLSDDSTLIVIASD
jgi:sigma-B regulation protein RsbU (phosphoserine phosphatase)